MKRTSREVGFGIVGIIIIFLILVLIGLIGWVGYQRIVTKPASVRATANTNSDPYAGWTTYASSKVSKVSFKYPSGWMPGPGRGGDAYNMTAADVTSVPFTNAGAVTDMRAGASVYLYMQLINDGAWFDCASLGCKITSLTSLSNPQLPGALLAIVNETSGNGTGYTEFGVVSSGTKVGDNSMKLAGLGSSSYYMVGQPIYYPNGEGEGLSEAADITHVDPFRDDSHFKDLVSLINSIRFDSN